MDRTADVPQPETIALTIYVRRRHDVAFELLDVNQSALARRGLDVALQEEMDVPLVKVARAIKRLQDEDRSVAQAVGAAETPEEFITNSHNATQQR